MASLPVPTDQAHAAAHEAILDDLSRMGVDRQQVIMALKTGARDEFTTAYCLLWQKRSRKVDVADDDADVGEPDSPSLACTADPADPALIAKNEAAESAPPDTDLTPPDAAYTRLDTVAEVAVEPTAADDAAAITSDPA